MQEHPGNDDAEGTAPGNQAELVKSYLAFARRSIANRRLIAALIFVATFLLALGALAIWPRSYHCELRLMVQRSSVLDQDERSNPLESATDVVMRHENAVALVRELGLAKDWAASRPPIFRVKDRISAALVGTPSEKDVSDALVAMVESRLRASVDGNALTIGVDWPEPRVAKRIVDAAKENFLRTRHNAEISVIQEKMSIVESHSTRLRTEIEGIAQELGRLKEEKLAAAEKAARRVSQAAAGPASPVSAPAPRRMLPQPPPNEKEDLTAVTEELQNKKQRLSELQARRNQGLLDAKSKLIELKLKLTEDHPEVRSTEQRITLLSQPPPEESSLQGEVDALDARIKRSTASARVEAGVKGSLRAVGGSASVAATVTETLPTEILRLLDDSNDMDPAISAQLSTALYKYGELRNELRTQRVALDTAQAAFNFRYQIVAPAAVPMKPSKPKVPLVLAIGFAVALAASLLIPILLELKTGTIVERWQVHQLNLPILGELHIPPSDR